MMEDLSGSFQVVEDEISFLRVDFDDPPKKFGIHAQRELDLKNLELRMFIPFTHLWSHDFSDNRIDICLKYQLTGKLKQFIYLRY